MRSYKNLEGDTIVVSQEHLETAVRIKRELQMASPSHRCNWNQHKLLMEKEGFLDSEVSEGYRQLIKSYQVSTGTIESKEKHADIVATSKLASIKEATGELFYTKREVQMESLKLNRLKRELTLFGVIAEEIREALINELNEVIPTYAYQPRLSGKGRMVVFLSDWHIGATVDNVLSNSYNLSIAKKRIAKYLSKIKKIAREEGITDIDVVCLGDMTEGVSMRNVTQSYEAEFPLAVQIVKAYELVRDFIVNLSEKHNVTYRGISGNHDRMNGKKEDNIDGDSTIFVINFMIKEFVEAKEAERIQYFEADHINYSVQLDINGIKIKAVHGDNEKGNKLLATHGDIDDTNYNVIAMGHLHHFHVREVGRNKFEAYFGSLQGVNNYALKGKFLSNASQGIIVINEYNEIEIRRIDLQDV